MSEIEKIRQYVSRTKIDPELSLSYSMRCSEMCALYNAMQEDAFAAMSLIFNFGKAKGYRAGKSEARK